MRRGDILFWGIVAWLIFRKRNGSAGGNVVIESASMTSRGKTTEATQRQLDYANAVPASEPE